MDDSKELFDYWYERIRFTDTHLIESPQHVQTFKLRHNCTNYDNLIYSNEVRQIDEPERSRVIAVIKYECTARVLQRRAGYLREQANKLEGVCFELNDERGNLLGFIDRLKKILFGKDQEITKLNAKIASLATKNEALLVQTEQTLAQEELHKELENLKKRYEEETNHRKRLAKNNQSLGGRVAHTTRYKRKLDAATLEVKALQDQLKVLEQDNQILRQENQYLTDELAKLQKRSKLGIIDIRKP